MMSCTGRPRCSHRLRRMLITTPSISRTMRQLASLTCFRMVLSSFPAHTRLSAQSALHSFSYRIVWTFVVLYEQLCMVCMCRGQALETWQCPSLGVGPNARKDCATNPMPQVAGLHALLPRLIALSKNSTLVPDLTMGDKWTALLKRVPDLPVGTCMQGAGGGTRLSSRSTVCISCQGLVPATLMSYVTVAGSSTCLLPAASLPPKPSNVRHQFLRCCHQRYGLLTSVPAEQAENADLYAVHPFRGKLDMPIGVHNLLKTHNRLPAQNLISAFL